MIHQGVEKNSKENNKDNFENKDLKAEIIKELDKFGRSNGLKGFELPKKIHLTQERFSVENQIGEHQDRNNNSVL